MLLAVGDVDIAEQVGGLGLGIGFGQAHGVFDQLCNLAVDAFELRRIQPAFSAAALAEQRQAIRTFAQLFHSSGRDRLRITFKVAVEAAQFHFNQRRPIAFARSRHGDAKRLMHGEEIIAIDDHARHAKPHGAFAMSLHATDHAGTGASA